MSQCTSLYFWFCYIHPSDPQYGRTFFTLLTNKWLHHHEQSCDDVLSMELFFSSFIVTCWLSFRVRKSGTFSFGESTFGRLECGADPRFLRPNLLLLLGCLHKPGRRGAFFILQFPRECCNFLLVESVTLRNNPWIDMLFVVLSSIIQSPATSLRVVSKFKVFLAPLVRANVMWSGAAAGSLQKVNLLVPRWCNNKEETKEKEFTNSVR